MSKKFSVLVVGTEPQDILEYYSLMNDSEPYVKYRYDDKEKIQKSLIKKYENTVKYGADVLTKSVLDELKEQIKSLKKLSPLNFYKEFTDKYVLIIDDNGDALSTENPNGKFDECSQKGNFSEPLILLEHGSEGELMASFTALKGQIDWGLMHKQQDKVDLYNRTWDLCHGIIDPENPTDETIISNMNTVSNYFSRFPNKEMFVNYSTCFKCSAFCDGNKWVDIDESGLDEFQWVSTFYDKYVKNLSDDTQLSVFECILY